MTKKISTRDLLQMALDSLVSRCGTNAEEQELLIPMLRDELAKPEPEPVAWIFPSDLEKFESSETFAQAFSICVGNPDETTLPLYRKEYL